MHELHVQVCANLHMNWNSRNSRTSEKGNLFLPLWNRDVDNDVGERLNWQRAVATGWTSVSVWVLQDYEISNFNSDPYGHQRHMTPIPHLVAGMVGCERTHTHIRTCFPHTHTQDDPLLSLAITPSLQSLVFFFPMAVVSSRRFCHPAPKIATR